MLLFLKNKFFYIFLVGAITLHAMEQKALIVNSKSSGPLLPSDSPVQQLKEMVAHENNLPQLITRVRSLYQYFPSAVYALLRCPINGKGYTVLHKAVVCKNLGATAQLLALAAKHSLIETLYSENPDILGLAYGIYDGLPAQDPTKNIAGAIFQDLHIYLQKSTLSLTRLGDIMDLCTFTMHHLTYSEQFKANVRYLIEKTPQKGAYFFNNYFQLTLHKARNDHQFAAYLTQKLEDSQSS